MCYPRPRVALDGVYWIGGGNVKRGVMGRGRRLEWSLLY